MDNNEKSVETLEAKLRNQLTPIYGICDIILLLDGEEGMMKPELIKIIIDLANLANKNKDKIDKLLQKIEAQHDSKTKDKIELLEKFIVHPNKPGYKRNDIVSKIKELKKQL